AGAGRYVTGSFQEAEFGAVRLALVEAEAQVAAEQRLALCRHAVADRAGDGIDAADSCNAERDAGKENGEAGKAAAHFAQGKAEGKRKLAGHRHHAIAVAASAGPLSSVSPVSMRPERMAMRREQRAASAGS